MVKANLIVSYDPSHISSAKDEVSNILKDIKGEAKFLKPNIDGVFEINVKNAKNTVKKLNKEFAKRKKLFERTFHWVPIDKWCKAEIKKMQAEIKKFAKGIKKNDKWKMELNKRSYGKHGTTELILKLTEIVENPKVDLEKPGKIIKVEIIGNKAGLSLLNPDEILDVPKKKK